MIIERMPPIVTLLVAIALAGCASQPTSGKDYAGQGRTMRECPAGQIQVCTSKQPREISGGEEVQPYDSCICRIAQY